MALNMKKYIRWEIPRLHIVERPEYSAKYAADQERQNNHGNNLAWAMYVNA
jgi:hypothetical protein